MKDIIYSFGVKPKDLPPDPANGISLYKKYVAIEMRGVVALLIPLQRKEKNPIISILMIFSKNTKLFFFF